MADAAVSVVVPTIGRPELLDAALASIGACVPAPAEILVVDQSDGVEVAEVARRHGDRVVVLRGSTPGIAGAINLGLRRAHHDVVLVTNDDCTVASDWIEVALRSLGGADDVIVSGQVRAPDGADPAMVPSLITDPEPRLYERRVFNVLYGANMAADRRALLALGGFDERRSFRTAAEDLDLCWRWTTAGGRVRYEPSMVVWHHDWRSPEQLADRYVVYARGLGAFYAKHVRAGDRYLLRRFGRDLRSGVRATIRGVVRREPRWARERRGAVRGLVPGFVGGWWEARRLDRLADGPSPDDPEPTRSGGVRGHEAS